MFSNQMVFLKPLVKKPIFPFQVSGSFWGKQPLSPSYQKILELKEEETRTVTKKNAFKEKSVAPPLKWEAFLMLQKAIYMFSCC